MHTSFGARTRAEWSTGARALLRAPFLALGAIVLCASMAPEDWPQWRGPEGLGVSAEENLPVVLGLDAPSLRWRVEIEGEGISSPVVQDGRVYVTTAYPGEELSRVENLVDVGVPALGVLVVVLGLIALLSSRREEGAQRGFLGTLDLVATVAATGLFLVAILLALFRPRLFPSWDDGVLGWAWFHTGWIALVALTAAIGWSEPRSLVRPVGALALLGLAAYLWKDIGLNSYGQEFRAKYRVVMVAPAVAGALWQLVMFLRGPREGARGGATARLLGGAAILAMAGTVFFSINLHQPRAGLLRAVVCLDLETGRKLWDTPLFVAPLEQKFDDNSFATPTAIVDQDRVFAYFGSGWACLDLEGNVLWRGRDDTYAANTRYGCGASPVLFEDTYVILQEKEYNRPSFIMALDRETGSEVFHVTPQYASDSYSTPILVEERDGATELLTASAERVVAHDPRNGELLWQVSVPIRQMVPSMCVLDDLVLVSGGTHTKTSTSAVRLDGSGKETRAEVVWQTDKAAPDCSSPVVVNDLLFTVTSGGIMVCYDPRTGKRHWKERLEPGEWRSSLVAGDGKVYAISTEGIAFTVAAKSEFEVLGRGELDEDCQTTPAIADGRVLVRTRKHLSCFGEPTAAR